MIDLHSHILPGLDDGPRGLEGSLELGSVVAEQGVSTIVATPHLHEKYPNVDPAALPAACGEVQAALADAGVALEVVPGGEVDAVWAREASPERLALATYGQRGTDLLLESPFGVLPPGFEELVLERLMGSGLRVVLAHPERSTGFRDRPSRLAALVDAGALVQLTASSLLAGRRSQSRRFARRLIEEGYAHVIASDAHRGHEFRPPRLLEGRDEIASSWGEARARWMTEDAPAAILAGEAVPEMPPLARRGRFGRLLRTTA